MVGSGYGYGSGSGYGYGSGSGDGYGSGSGYGYGSGYGDGFGYGYGDGYLDPDFMACLLACYTRDGMAVAFWRSNKDGAAVNGGSGSSRKVGDVEEVQGPLEICTPNALHGTYDVTKWKGEKLWIVGLYEPTVRQDDKIASLKRKMIADLGCWL